MLSARITGTLSKLVLKLFKKNLRVKKEKEQELCTFFQRQRHRLLENLSPFPVPWDPASPTFRISPVWKLSSSSPEAMKSNLAIASMS